MQFYKEYSPKVYTRHGDMRPSDVATALHGFSTVYSFSEEHANIIRSSGSSKGLNKYPVYADCITFDLDNGDKYLKPLIEWFTEKGLGYRLYDSGNKGYHLCVDHTPIYDIDLPYTHRLLAEATGVEYDPTLYQAGRLLRNIGTIHEKSGRPKQLIEEVEGESLLEITLRHPPESRFKISEVEDEELLPFVFSRVAQLVNNSPGAGRRHVTFYGLAKDAARCGISFDTVLEMCQLVNSTWGGDSKESEQVRSSVEGGYE